MAQAGNVLGGNQAMNESERIIRLFSSYCVYTENQLVIEYHQTGRRTIRLQSEPRLQQNIADLVSQHPDQNENDWALFFIQEYKEDSANELARKHLICFLESVLNDVLHERGVAYERRNTPICIRINRNYQSHPELNLHMSDLLQMGREKICDLDFFIESYQPHLSHFRNYVKHSLRREILDDIFCGRLRFLLATSWNLLRSQSNRRITRALSLILRPEEIQDYLDIREIFLEHYIYPEGSNPLPEPTNEQLQTMAEVYSVTSFDEITGDEIREKLQTIARAVRQYLTMPTSSLNAPIGIDPNNPLEIIDFLESNDSYIAEDIIPNFQIQELLTQIPTFLIKLKDKAKALAVLKYGLECTVRESNSILGIQHSPYIDTRQIIDPVSEYLRKYLIKNYNISENSIDIENVKQLVINLLYRYYFQLMRTFLGKKSHPLPKHQVKDRLLIDTFIEHTQREYLQPLELELSQVVRSIIEERLLRVIHRWRNIER